MTLPIIKKHARSILSLLAFVTSCYAGFAQGEIPVNMYTGSPGIFINLATVTDHDLSETLTLSYNVNGINVNAPSNYGTGWSLVAGGQISREVRGLPDDLYNNSSRNGWLNNSNYSNVLLFPNSSDNSTGTCTDEVNDQVSLANTTYNNDTEPDIFSFSAGSYSGKFVFDNSGSIKLIPYQDISIVPTFDNTTHAITSWTITTPSGVVHTFNETLAISRTVTKIGDQTFFTLFDRDYNQYQTQVNYISAWMLTKTQSPTGAYLNYEYTIPADGTNTSNQPRIIQIFDSGFGSAPLIYYTMNETVTSTRKLLSKVTASSGMYATCDPSVGVQVVDPSRSATSFKNFNFVYTNGMLTSLIEQDGNSCIQLPAYKFYYNAWTGEGQSSASQDAWGFYNESANLNANYQRTYFPTIYVYPSEAASERYRLYRLPAYSGQEIILQGDANLLPNPQAITSGALSTIVYPTGGAAVFAFEINQYYDTRASQNQNGGGLRIKSITYFDGINKASNIVKNFSYVDGNGHSTGKLINRPSYVIPLWQQKIPTSTKKPYSQFSGNAVWRDLTAVTSFDIGNTGDTKGSSVGYTHVTVTSPGRGRAEFDYAVPAAWGDGSTGSNPTDWSPTLMKFARPAAQNCITMGIVAGAENYGYAPFPVVEYDYERGLITAKTEYNEANKIVRTTQTTYQYIYNPLVTQPTPVVGLAYDRFANADDAIFLYGRYSLLTNVAKIVSTETVTTYDEKNTARLSTNSTKYYYSSSNHRFVSKVEQTAPDQTIYATNFKYVPDYTTGASSDTTVQMIASLKTLKRTNTVIEQWSTVKPSGGIEKTSGASLVMFRPFTANKPLLRYQKVFKPNGLVSDFNPSYTDGSNNFIADNRYETVSTINEYDAFDTPISSTGQNKISAGSLWGFTQRLPVAQFSNARSTNIAFSDFETSTISSFTETNNYYGTGRTGVKGVHPYTTLTRSVVRPALASNYILSFWAKPLTVGSTLTLTVVLTYTGGSSSNNYSFNFDATNTDYQYFTKVISVTAVPSGGTFTLQVQGQGFTAPGGAVGSLNTSLLPLLDDVSFYPDYANISSTTYDIPFGPNSVTGSSGTTVYTTYDAIGRTKWVADQDHNVRQRTSYSATSQGTAQLTAALSTGTSGFPAGTAVTFTAVANPCFPGATYEWDFGAGYGSSAVHTYSAIGNYTINLRVTHPTAGTVVSAIPITVVDPTGTLAVAVTSSGVDGSGWVTLTATPSGSGLGITQRQWYQRSTGSSTWNLINGVSGGTLTRKILPTTSIDFKCTETNTVGAAASGTITVSN